MWVEPDCNLPDGESLARQMLVGTRYFEHEFGVETKVVWLPDCFGFTWALPSLMAAAGLPYFVTHKLSWSQTNRIPHDTFRWRGPDGSEVLAHFLCTPSLWPGEHTTYNGTLLPSIARGAWRRFQDRQLQKELLVAFGWGDGGGGPTIEMIEAGRRLKDLPGFPRVQMGRARLISSNVSSRTCPPGRTCRSGTASCISNTTAAPTRARRGRSCATRCPSGCTTPRSCTPRVRARCLGAPYPREELEEGWRLILTNQFHDILPGSAISSVYVDAEADYQRLAGLGQAILDCDRRVWRAVSTWRATHWWCSIRRHFRPPTTWSSRPSSAWSSQSTPPLPAANPAHRRRRPAGVVRGRARQRLSGVPHRSRGRPPSALSVTGAAGAIHPGGSPKERAQAGPPAPALQASTREVESPFWRIELDERGHISRLWDKRNERDVVPPGQVANRLVVFEDKPINFDAWDIDAYFYAKSSDVDTLESATVRETGPERAVVEFRWRIGERSHIVQRLCVYARSPRIDFVNDVEWQERQSLLKVAFPTGIRNRRATYEIQFGTIDRPTHQNTSWEQAAFEVPAQRWVDLSDAHHGVALLADCKHGYSVRDDTLWLSLLKGAIDPDPDADRGQHRFTYSLLPHAAGLDDVRRAGYSLTRPLLWRREGAHPGPLPPQFSLASVTDPGVVVETAKWAEDEEALIVRLYEADGGDTSSASLALGVQPRPSIRWTCSSGTRARWSFLSE